MTMQKLQIHEAATADGSCYVIGGRAYPRVTHILEAAGLVDFRRVPDAVLGQAQWRGSAVHQACLYDDQGDLDEATVKPEHMPYLAAWRKAKRDLKFTESASERIYDSCHRLRFAGRPDRWGYSLDATWPILIDLKTGPVQPSVAWQLAAYASLIPHRSGGPIPARFAVRLSPDGRYTIKEYPRAEYARDLAVFNAALQLWWTRKEAGLL